MNTTAGRIGILVAATLWSSLLSGCGSPRPIAPAPPAEPAKAPRAPAVGATRPAEDQVARPPDDKNKKDVDPVRQEAKKARERERKRARLEHSLEVAQLSLAKATIAVEQGELKYNDQLAQAEMEFELAKRRQQIFTKFTAPNRLARAELGLQQAEDGSLEAREELDQLVLMYSEEQFADQTKEIVIERAKRRLARAERDLELRRDELKTLKEVSLPLEQSEVDLAAEQRKRAALQVQRDNEGALLDRRVAALNAEAEVTRLEDELADVVEEIQDAQQKAAESQPTTAGTKP